MFPTRPSFVPYTLVDKNTLRVRDCSFRTGGDVGDAGAWIEDPGDLGRKIRRPRATAADPARLVQSTVGWVRKAVSLDSASVQVLVPDAIGHLRVFAAAGD